MDSHHRKFAVVTGASSGIGYELAKCCVDNGFDVLTCADDAAIDDAADQLAVNGAGVGSVQADLSTPAGVTRLYAAIKGRKVDALLANAGVGLGGAFLDQDFQRVKEVVETNILGTIDLVQRVGRDMRSNGSGKILITGSIAGLMPGTFQAVYNGTKAFLDSFAFALRAELKDTGVTVTCLMPGATETDFFERADMLDTKVGTKKKQPPEEVAKAGFDAMMKGAEDVVTGWDNKLRAAISHLLPNSLLAERHRKEAAPGTAVPRP